MGIRSELDCIACVVSQAVRVARIAGLDEDQGRQLLAELCLELRNMDSTLSPPEHGVFLYRRLAELSGRPDPLAEVKRRHTEAALLLIPAVRAVIEAAPNPLDTALRLAAMGNRLDLGTRSSLEEPEELLKRALEAEPGRWELEPFVEALQAAENLLLIADNAGEIVFDRVLLEVIRGLAPSLELTVVVRGEPVINDATVDDARAAGIHEVARLIDSGSGIPGFVPHKVAPEALAAFESADLVLAKGQGNFETLTGAGRELFFLLQVKCAVVERHTGVSKGSSILMHESA